MKKPKGIKLARGKHSSYAECCEFFRCKEEGETFPPCIFIGDTDITASEALRLAEWLKKAAKWLRAQ